MTPKYLAIALLGTSLLAGAAMAQTSTTTTKTNKVDIATASTMNHEGQWRASKLVGLSVYNDANDKLGNIEELIVNKSGNIEHVILSVGGFLGMGEHYVAVSFDKLKWVNEPVKAAGATNAPATTTTKTGDGTARTTTGTSTTTTTTARPVRSADEHWYPDHAVLNETKDQLKGMKEFKY